MYRLIIYFSILLISILLTINACLIEKKYSYIEFPVVLVTNNNKLDNLINILKKIEYHNAENKIININIKIIEFIDINETYDNINIFDKTKDYLHIFYLDEYITYGKRYTNYTIRSNDELLQNYVKFNKLQFSTKRKSLIIYGYNDINNLISSLNYAISKNIKNLKDIGKSIYIEKISLYKDDKNIIDNIDKIDDILMNECIINYNNFKIISCNTNRNNRRHCCSDKNDFTGSLDYNLIVNYKNHFIIVPIVKEDENILNDEFIISMKYVHFNIEYTCIDDCYNLYNIIGKAINELNNKFYNVKFSYSKSSSYYYTNLIINIVDKIKQDRHNEHNISPIERTYGSLYNSDKIIIDIIKNNDDIIKNLIIHAISSHGFLIGHQSGQIYNDITSAMYTPSNINKYFIFNNISPFFRINNDIVTKNINDCINIKNTSTTHIYQCNKNYFRFDIIYQIQEIKEINKHMFNETINKFKKIKLYSYVNDTLNNLFLDSIIVDNNDIEYIDYYNDYTCGYINSRCISIAIVKYNSKIYYVNLGNYNSLIYIAKENYAICCIDGISCDNIRNNSTSIVQNYRSSILKLFG